MLKMGILSGLHKELYPDVIESGVSKGPAAVIKSHHNVGGLPDWLNLKLLEPTQAIEICTKMRLRKIAKVLDVPACPCVSGTVLES